MQIKDISYITFSSHEEMHYMLKLRGTLYTEKRSGWRERN